MPFKNCPSCGKLNTVRHKNCPKCGAFLGDSATSRQSSFDTDPASVSRMPSSFETVEAQTTPPPLPPRPAAHPVADVKPMPKFCPECGAPVIAGTSFCGNCGHRHAATAPQQQPAPTTGPFGLDPHKNPYYNR